MSSFLKWYVNVIISCVSGTVNSFFLLIHPKFLTIQNELMSKFVASGLQRVSCMWSSVSALRLPIFLFNVVEFSTLLISHFGHHIIFSLIRWWWGISTSFPRSARVSWGTRRGTFATPLRMLVSSASSTRPSTSPKSSGLWFKFLVTFRFMVLPAFAHFCHLNPPLMSSSFIVGDLGLIVLSLLQTKGRYARETLK